MLTAVLPSSPDDAPAQCSRPLRRVAIFCATRWETAAVRAAFHGGCEETFAGFRAFVECGSAGEYWLVQTGIGPEKAGGAASATFQQAPFDLAVSTGFACALIPAEIGDLLVGCEVTLAGANGEPHSGPIEVPGQARDAFLACVSRRVRPDHRGRFASVARVVGRAREKRRFAEVTGAVGLDMESAALAREASRARVPFAILRAVSDLVDEDLPLDFNLFLRPTGWIEGVSTLLTSPSSLAGLMRLRRQGRRAADSLTNVFRDCFKAGSPEDCRHGPAENA